MESGEVVLEKKIHYICFYPALLDHYNIKISGKCIAGNVHALAMVELVPDGVVVEVLLQCVCVVFVVI